MLNCNFQIPSKTYSLNIQVGYPEMDEDGDFFCHFETKNTFHTQNKIYGVTEKQAVQMVLKLVSAHLKNYFDGKYDP